jgi:hypothetical protein
MKDEDIYNLFNSVAENSIKHNEPVRKVFSILVRTTLKYRDDMKETKGLKVTVEDVKTTLDLLLESLNTGRLPETKDKVRLDLLKLWLDEFRRV